MGNSGRDELHGEAGNDRLYGLGNDDILMGGDGVDWLMGGDGDDVLDGGTKRDHLWGGTGSDTFILAVGDGFDVIRDFEQGTDLFHLDGGLDFGDLSFEVKKNKTIIQVMDSGEALARLNGNFVLGISDFV